MFWERGQRLKGVFVRGLAFFVCLFFCLTTEASLITNRSESAVRGENPSLAPIPSYPWLYCPDSQCFVGMAQWLWKALHPPGVRPYGAVASSEEGTDLSAPSACCLKKLGVLGGVGRVGVQYMVEEEMGEEKERHTIT